MSLPLSECALTGMTGSCRFFGEGVLMGVPSAERPSCVGRMLEVLLPLPTSSLQMATKGKRTSHCTAVTALQNVWVLSK